MMAVQGSPALPVAPFVERGNLLGFSSSLPACCSAAKPSSPSCRARSFFDYILVRILSCNGGALALCPHAAPRFELQLSPHVMGTTAPRALRLVPGVSR